MVKKNIYIKQQQQQPSCLSDDDDDEHLTWKPYFENQNPNNWIYSGQKKTITTLGRMKNPNTN
ncbi:hypothetical protein DERF_004905 [Dermatophagoides farinae]|uniref:Uncharacterized protein n=1 Tax=Dermatophagoides farinae TaxID=6954 RepID=A0A922L5P2_DERFA|nr:hypothetical protein DERF_004905 [Dermatophagoides farinae]